MVTVYNVQVLQPKSDKQSGNITARSCRNKNMFAVQMVITCMLA